MASQTFLPNAADLSCASEAAAKTRWTSVLRTLRNLRPLFFILATFAGAATAEAVVPRLHFLLFQLPFFAAPILITYVIRYMREFHPAHAPSILDADSRLLSRLRTVRNAFGWTTLAEIAALCLLLRYAATSDPSCTCDFHPGVVLGLMALGMVPCLGYVSLAAYIGARTQAPVRRGLLSGDRIAARRHFSEFKPIHSDYWGQR